VSESLGLEVKPREGAAERCPYCHDCLAGGVLEDVQVVCEGCGTAHHRACLAELGGCTVMGCPGGKARPLGAVDEVRARVRTRLESFLTHTRRPAKVESRLDGGGGWSCVRCEVFFGSADCAGCGRELDAICREDGHPCSGCGRRHFPWRGRASEQGPAELKRRARSRAWDWILGGLMLGIMLVLLGAVAWAWIP